MNPADLPLRDIHLPPDPSWWPPAPGWWLLCLLLLIALFWAARALRGWLGRRRRAARLAAEFRRAAALPDPAARLAAISELLRRAARLRDPAAASLSGEDWLRHLDAQDGLAPGVFLTGPGRLLLDGPFRPQVSEQDVAALVDPARRCFEAMSRR